MLDFDVLAEYRIDDDGCQNFPKSWDEDEGRHYGGRSLLDVAAGKEEHGRLKECQTMNHQDDWNKPAA